MAANRVSARMCMQIELALDGPSDDSESSRDKDDRARKLGMIGAEIDAARSRRSFDIQTSAAIDLACAVASSDLKRIAGAEAVARSLGFHGSEIGQIKDLGSHRSTRDKDVAKSPHCQAEALATA